MSEILVNSLKTAAGVNTLSFDSTGDVLLATGKLGTVSGNTIQIDSDGVLIAPSVSVSSAITLPAGSIDSDMIGAGAVKASKIASGAVEGAMTTQFGRRNLIINGAMQVAQRGTSFTVDNSDNEQYTLDRFKCFNVTGGGTDFTVEQSSDAPDTFTSSLKVTNSSAHTIASTDYSTLGQYVEGYNMSATGMGTSAAKNVTLSFWVKSSVTGTYGVTLRAGSSATANYTASYNIDSASTWEYKTITFPATSSGTWGTTNGIGGDFFWDLGVGSNYSQSAGSWNTASNEFGLTGGTKLTETAGATWYITGVQLEVGSVATPYEHRSYGEELALCQRYYTDLDSIFLHGIAYQAASGGNGLGCPITFPTTMRDAPTPTASNIVDGGSATTMKFGRINKVGMMIEAEQTITSNDVYVYADVVVDAEL